MTSQLEQGKIEPKTIFRHAYGVYPSMAMLAGMQLDVFSPLRDGPMSGARLAEALDVPQEKLRPLLYALVNAELLRIEGDRFANTSEGDRYLVRGRSPAPPHGGRGRKRRARYSTSLRNHAF